MAAYKDPIRKTWYVQFRVSIGNKQYKTIKKRGFRTKKEALLYESQYNQMVPLFALNKLSEAYDIYYEYCVDRLRIRTLYLKRRTFTNYILPYLGNICIKDITPLVILNWQKHLIAENTAFSNIRSSLFQLSALFNFGIKFYDLQTNPVQNAGSLISYNSHKFNFWTISEFHKFQKWNKLSPLTILVIEILYFTGLRWGELKALTAADFDFSKGTLSVTKSFSYCNKQHFILPPKTESGKRIITIPPFLMEKIKKYIDSLFIEKDTFIFPLESHTIRRALDKAAKELNLPRIRIHDLRHSHASLLVYLGFSPVMIKNRLGHKNIKITMDVYTQMYIEEEKEIVSKLNILEENMEKSLWLCPVQYRKQDNSLVITFPLFPSIPSFIVNSVEDAIIKSNALLPPYIYDLINRGENLPSVSDSRSISNINHIFYINIPLSNIISAERII